MFFQLVLHFVFIDYLRIEQCKKKMEKMLSLRYVMKYLSQCDMLILKTFLICKKMRL